ncbi:MAG: hypothetical protein CL816_05160 [Coxiellaceae bacterium]|nr:hypothetical protein [Coxiellaceae bacterium]|tara:strand:- start:2254 stop:2574 length:321 start_codon:yes stop_codon:yes gene_type:complete
MNHDRLTYDLISAVLENNAERVKELLEEGADANRPLDQANVTPLHYAAQHNALNCIPLLIDAGANLFAKTEPDGQIPVEISLLHRHQQVTQLLMHYIQSHDKTTIN